MDQGLLMIIAAAIILNCALLYIIIQSASRATKRLNMQTAIFHMLAKIARAQGVPEKEVEEVEGWMKQI